MRQYLGTGSEWKILCHLFYMYNTCVTCPAVLDRAVIYLCRLLFVFLLPVFLSPPTVSYRYVPFY